MNPSLTFLVSVIDDFHSGLHVSEFCVFGNLSAHPQFGLKRENNFFFKPAFL